MGAGNAVASAAANGARGPWGQPHPHFTVHQQFSLLLVQQQPDDQTAAPCASSYKGKPLIYAGFGTLSQAPQHNGHARAPVRANTSRSTL